MAIGLKRAIAAVSLACCLGGASPATAGGPELVAGPLYTLSVQGGGLGVSIDEVVILWRIRRSPRHVADGAWFAERRLVNHDLRRTVERHQWIDGRSCPALARVVTGIPRIPAARFAGADEDRRIPPSETPEIRLRGDLAPLGEAQGASLTRGEYVGPLADWWRGAVEVLGPCWRVEAVVIDGQALSPRLLSEADAAEWKP